MLYTVSGKLLDACVLGVINNGDTYGYDLTQNLGQVITVSESALYPVLRRLLSEGLLTSYNVPHDGRNRKYYQITELGRAQIEGYQDEWILYRSKIESLMMRGANNE